MILVVTVSVILCLGILLLLSSPNSTNTSSDISTTSRFLRKLQEIIIGGTSAGSGEFPWYAKFEGNTLCGGSVIGNGQFVLTAAHCVDDGYTPSQVRVGSARYSTGGTLYRVTNKWIHPNFTTGTYVNDLALLKIAKPCCILCCGDPETVALNSDASIPSVTGEELVVMGFGVTNSNNVPSSTLKKLTVNYIANEECSTNYGTFQEQEKLCADQENAGVCAGDSGGPLVIQDALNGNTWSQVGIVSVGRQGCASDFPDYYTRVSTYANNGWIQSTMDAEMSLVGPERDSILDFLQRNGQHWLTGKLRFWD